MVHEDGYDDNWKASLGQTHQMYLDIIECMGAELKKLFANPEKYKQSFFDR